MNFVKIFISSGVAFVFAILVAVLIETFGGAIGSVIGTLPFTIIPAAFIIITEQTKTVDERVESLMACLYEIHDLNKNCAEIEKGATFPHKDSESDPRYSILRLLYAAQLMKHLQRGRMEWLKTRQYVFNQGVYY